MKPRGKIQKLGINAMDLILITMILAVGSGAASDTNWAMAPLTPQQAGMGSISNPERSSGQVFVNINQNYRIVKYSPDGEKLTEWIIGGIIETNGMGIGPGGEIYVAVDNSRIVKYSPNGERLAEWNVEGATDIRGIAVGRSGEVFVNINNSHRVVKYSPYGEMLGEWTLEGDISSIAVDPNGRLIIVYPGSR